MRLNFRLLRRPKGLLAMTKLVLFGSLIILLSGCGGKVNGNAQSAAAPVEVKVAFWGAPDEVNIITGIIKDWQKTHPGIVVRLEHTPYHGYVEKLLTRMAGHSSPDIICTEVDLFVTFQSKDVLLDLLPYINSDREFDLKQFYPQILDRFTVNGKLYAIPRDVAPYACVYYNKKIFDEAGVAYPTDDWTVQDLQDKAVKLTKLDESGRVTRYGFYMLPAMAWPSFIYAFGGSLVDNIKAPSKCTLNSKESLAGLGFYSDLINKYKVHPTAMAMTNMAMGIQGMFMTGRVAMFASGIWETPGLRKMNGIDWDIVMFPKGPTGIRAFGTGGSGYCILKDTSHPKEAFEVLKALAGRQAQTMLADTGLAQPAIKDIVQSSHWALNDSPPKNKGMLDEAMKYVVYEPFSPAWREAKELYINPELDLVFGGEKSLESVVNNFIGKVDDLLARK